jgi:hypothetical protein
VAVINSCKPITAKVRKKTVSFLGGVSVPARCREEDLKAPIEYLPMYSTRPSDLSPPRGALAGLDVVAELAILAQGCKGGRSLPRCW